MDRPVLTFIHAGLVEILGVDHVIPVSRFGLFRQESWETEMNQEFNENEEKNIC